MQKNVKRSAEKTKKLREIGDFSQICGFWPKSRNLLHPWNRDFLEGQVYQLQCSLETVRESVYKVCVQDVWIQCSCRSAYTCRSAEPTAFPGSALNTMDVNA